MRCIIDLEKNHRKPIINNKSIFLNSSQKLIKYNIFIILLLLLFAVETNCQKRQICPDFTCKGNFLHGLPNKNLSEAAKKYQIKEIRGSVFENRKIYSIKFDTTGKIIERDYRGLTYKYFYDSLGRNNFSELFVRGIETSDYHKEYHCYDETGNPIKIVEAHIKRKNKIDSLGNIISIENSRITIVYRNQEVVRLEYNLDGRRINPDTATIKTIGITHLLRTKDLKYYDLDVFKFFDWEENNNQIIKEKNSIEEVVDNFNRKWNFIYNEQGLRIKEKIKKGENQKHFFKALTMKIEYEFYETE